MSEKKYTNDHTNSLASLLSEPAADLIDFFNRWPEFKPTAEALLARDVLSDEERGVIVWLVLLADRVSRDDI